MPQSRLGLIPSVRFVSRWLQLPRCLGPIVAPVVRVPYISVELAHRVHAARVAVAGREHSAH